MSRRIGLLVATLGLGTAVALAGWMKRQDEHAADQLAPPMVGQWESRVSDVPIDPGAAMSTIHDLRSQFGSVLADSALEAPFAGQEGLDFGSEPESFDDFLRVEAGVPLPTNITAGSAEVGSAEVGSAEAGSAEAAAPDGLASSLRNSAKLLLERARQASRVGDTAQEMRFLGLATLLRAEAAALAKRDVADGQLVR